MQQNKDLKRCFKKTLNNSKGDKILKIENMMIRIKGQNLDENDSNKEIFNLEIVNVCIAVFLSL